MDQDRILKLLISKISPALGCTEPAALAYAGALAAQYTSGQFKRIHVIVDKNLYKNCLRVTIPGTELKGLEYAVALGIIGGKPKHRLEVLSDLSSKEIREAERLVSSGIIDLEIKPGSGLYISVIVNSEMDEACCKIEGNHSRVTLLECNGNKLSLTELNCDQKADDTDWLTIPDIFKFIHSIPIDALNFLDEARQMNYDLALIGINDRNSSNIGPVLNTWHQGDLEFECLANYARSLTAAGCDARMNGKPHPVMALDGSGNQGIASLVPIYTITEALELNQEVSLRAFALSCLVTLYIKSKLGLLTAVCGCAVAAGAGVSAAVTYTYGGDDKQIEAAIINLIGGLACIICDGAKGSCAFKIAIAVGAAFDSAKLALNNRRILPGDGIADSSIEGTVDNLVIITREGMQNLDDTLVQLLGGKIYLNEDF